MTFMNAGGRASLSSGIAFFHRLAVRQALPIAAGLLALLFASLALCYLHARDGLLHTAGTRARRIADAAIMANAQFLQHAEKSMAGIVRYLERVGPEDAVSKLQTGRSAVDLAVSAAFSVESAWKEVSVNVVDGSGFQQSVLWSRSGERGMSSSGQSFRKELPPWEASPGARVTAGAPGARWLPLPALEGPRRDMLIRYTIPLVEAGDGTPKAFGGVSLTASLSWLGDFVDGMAGLEGIQSIILSPEGMYLTKREEFAAGTPDSLEAGSGLASLAALGGRASAGKSELISLSWDGEQQVAIVAPLAPRGMSLAVLIPEKTLFGQLNDLTRKLFLFALGSLALAVWSLHATTRGMLRPLEYLMNMALRLSRGQLEPYTGGTGQAFVLATGGSRTEKDEPGRLLHAADALRLALKRRVEDLTLAATARERMLGELALAREIQEGIRPKDMPRATNLDTAARLHVTRAVCGDMYDAFFRSPHALCCVLGDVAARGVSASLLMGRVIPPLHEALLSGMTPAMALETVNKTLLAGGTAAGTTTFVSIVAGVLDIRTGHFTWASAGQPPPLHIRAASVRELPWSEDVPLGVRTGVRYRNLDVQLEAGEGLFFASDGLSTARSGTGRLYGETRLAEALALFSSDWRLFSCEALLRAMYEDVLAFSSPDGPQDDIAMLAVHWRG